MGGHPSDGMVSKKPQKPPNEKETQSVTPAHQSGKDFPALSSRLPLPACTLESRPAAGDGQEAFLLLKFKGFLMTMDRMAFGYLKMPKKAMGLTSNFI